MARVLAMEIIDALSDACDGLVEDCACGHNDECPLGKIGSDQRCSVAELLLKLREQF